MSYTCQGCGDKYKIDILIDDELWGVIKPRNKSTGGGLLCGKCIMKRIENLGNYGAYTLIKI